MDLNLSGKTALITGASSGLGFAAALTLASEGADLIINSRDQSRIDSAARRIEQETGQRPLAVAADVGTGPGRTALLSVLAEFDRSIDILVSNTGGPPPGQFLDLSPESFEQSNDLLLNSAVGLTRAFLPGMIERSWGRLIYITSISVLQPVDSLLLSNTYRAAVTGFCKSVSNNYAQHGITANCVCPGYTDTERLQSLAESLARTGGSDVLTVLDGFASVTPARRLGQPEELAALIAFLASDKAAYITGSSIAVDGGLNKALI